MIQRVEDHVSYFILVLIQEILRIVCARAMPVRTTQNVCLSAHLV